MSAEQQRLQRRCSSCLGVVRGTLRYVTSCSYYTETPSQSDLASHLVFVTGKSVPHMRKMADMVSRAVRFQFLAASIAGTA